MCVRAATRARHVWRPQPLNLACPCYSCVMFAAIFEVNVFTTERFWKAPAAVLAAMESLVRIEEEQLDCHKDGTLLGYSFDLLQDLNKYCRAAAASDSSSSSSAVGSVPDTSALAGAPAPVQLRVTTATVLSLSLQHAPVRPLLRLLLLLLLLTVRWQQQWHHLWCLA